MCYPKEELKEMETDTNTQELDKLNKDKNPPENEDSQRKLT